MLTDSPQKPQNKLLSFVQERVGVLDQNKAPEPLEAISSVEDARVRDALLRNRAMGDLPLDVIDPDPEQVRKVDKGEGLDELVSSVRLHGVITPISVRFQEATGRFQIIAGERRYQAAKRAGLKNIPAVLKDIDDTRKAIHQLVENLQRQNLNPIEEARAFHRYLAMTGKQQDELAKEIGKSKTYVSRTLALLEKLTAQEQQQLGSVANSQLPARTRLFEAVDVRDPQRRRAAIFGGLSFGEMREQVRRESGGQSKRRKTTIRRIQVENPPATVTVTLPDPAANDDYIRRALQAAINLVGRQ